MLKPKNGKLQNVEEEAVVQEPAGAGEVANGGNGGNNGGNGQKTTKSGRLKDMAKVAAVKEFRQAGLALAQEEDASGVEKGQSSSKVAFVVALGNPAKMGTRTEGKKEGIEVMEIVGWKFRAVEAVKAPVCKRENIAKSDTMGYSSIEWIDVPAGGEFTLTPAELSEMIALEEYNGLFTGDPENQVELHVTMPKVGQNKYAPNVTLKKIKISEDTRPIKAVVDPVATLNPGAPEGSKSIKDYTVLPEYAEKFGYIYEEAVRTGKGGSTAGQKRKPGENAGELAAALRAYKMRQAQAQ